MSAAPSDNTRLGNFHNPQGVWHSEALKPSGIAWRHPMTKLNLLAIAALMSTAITTPVLAQAIIQEPRTFALHHPNGDLGIGPTPSQRREVVVAGLGTAGAMALGPSFHPSKPGSETSTRPWSAPVGHRQPHLADVPVSTAVSQEILDPEDANVDRKIRDVCRGC